MTYTLSDEMMAELKRAKDQMGRCPFAGILSINPCPLCNPKPEVPEGCCELCGQPMPRGEESFRYHGYSGPCPPSKVVQGGGR